MDMDEYRFRRKEAYEDGFRDGWVAAMNAAHEGRLFDAFNEMAVKVERKEKELARKKPRKLSKWQKFVKQKSKLPRFKYKTGKRKGMVNMKAVAAAWRKVPKSKK